eukprot:6206139-Prymnesium_polylepis.1
MGFRTEIDAILTALRPTADRRQTLLFSATLPDDVRSLARSATRRGGGTKLVDAVGEGACQTNAEVQQSVTISSQQAQPAELFELLRALTTRAPGMPRAHGPPSYKVVVFFASARMVQLYAALAKGATAAAGAAVAAAAVGGRGTGGLGVAGGSDSELGNLRVLEMHSRLSQAVRTAVTADFRKSTNVVLFTTDISARGLDYPGVTAVVQLGIPQDRAQYVHRLGRTARAGKTGNAYLLLSECERPFLQLLADLPVQHRPALAPAAAKALQATLTRARSTVPDEILAASYQAWLGFYNSARVTTPLGWTKEEMANHANTFARAVLGVSPPAIK